MNGKLWKMGLQKFGIGCMIGIVMLLAGCVGRSAAKVTDEESALAFLQALDGYEARVNVVFFSNKGENSYTVHQRAKVTGEYRIEILEPESFAGVLTICDGSRVMQSDPTIEGLVEAKPTPVRDALLLYPFLEAYLQNNGEICEGEDDTLILSARYPGEHRKIVSAQLRLAKGSGLPLSLVVSDEAGNPSLHMTFLNFQQNPEFEESNFQIPG